jgi:glucokinase
LGCVYHLPFGDSNADDHFSTRWFIKRYKSVTGKDIPGVRELVALAETDSAARDIFSEFGRNLGIFLAPWLKRFGAEVLVIGGNISHAWHLCRKDFSASMVGENCETKAVVSDLKEDAALLGSAYLFDEKFWASVQHTLPLM